MQSIQGTTRILGVMGAPVEHSLSPAMHNAALAELGLDFVYLPFPVRPEDLPQALAGLAAIGAVGFNVTIPHKQAILPLLSRVLPAAQAVGAVNTVWREAGGWCGTNTDVDGFIAPLRERERDWSRQVPVVLGAGGAARAVVAGCGELGCREIRVVGRDRARLEKFKDSWQNTPLQGAISCHSWDELAGLVSTTELLVNATPVGMFPESERSPVSEEAWVGLKGGAIAYDLIYRPRPTRFLEQAKARGAEAIDGTEMLVQQGAAALKIWVQQPVPVAAMRQALLEQLA